MRPARRIALPVYAAALLCTSAPLFAQVEKPAPAEDPNIVTSELDKLDLVVKMRPILPEITTGDPLRIALHFEKKDGPIDHADQELAPQMIDRLTTLRSLEVAVKAPGGEWAVLNPDATLLPKDRASPRSLLSDGTFLFEFGAENLKLLNINGQEELSMPWKFGMLKPGEYQVALRGTLKLSTPQRKVQQRGQPPMEFPATETAVTFKTKPIGVAVVRADMKSQTLEELAKAAVEEVKKLPAVKEEELTVGGVESIPIADAEGNRVIRVKATIPQPKPLPGPDGGLIIGPVIAGGTGYWQYEVAMSPAGKAVSIARARKGFCVARGTKIATPDGEVAVEELQSGTQVWACDLDEQTLVPATVLAVFSSRAEETILLNGGLRLSADHPVFVRREEASAWKRAAELRENDVMLSQDRQPIRVASVETIGGEIDVFDVAVDGPHNFFAAGLLVHNKSIAWTPQHFVPWYALWNRATVK